MVLRAMLRASCLSAIVVVLVACGSGNGGTGIGPDGGTAADGGGDGGVPSLCTRQPENVRIQLCDPSQSNVLLACNEGAAPPSSECTKTVQVDAYCCPVPVTVTDAGTDAPSSSSLNPYGVPYPTDNIGTSPRAGAAPGNRMKNIGLQGYAPNVATLGTVSLASLYDPQGKTHDVVIIVAGALWDTFTGQTLTSIKGSTKRIATFAVLGQGATAGTLATLANLATWRGTFPWATTSLDAGFSVLGAYFDAQALPFIMFLDARTMEIATAGVGGLTTTEMVDSGVTAITSRPASY